MSKHFFQKAMINMALVIGGKVIQFESLGGNTGGIALDDSIPDQAALAAALNTFATKRIGGVIRVENEEAFATLKKKLESRQSLKRRSEKLRVVNPLVKKKLVSQTGQSQNAGADETKKPSTQLPTTPPPGATPPDNKPDEVKHPTNAAGLFLDGPTKEEWVKAGYEEAIYPPIGFAPKPLSREDQKILDGFKKSFSPATRPLKVNTGEPKASAPE